jgi:hypothetical protein
LHRLFARQTPGQPRSKLKYTETTETVNFLVDVFRSTTEGDLDAQTSTVSFGELNTLTSFGSTPAIDEKNKFIP